MCLYYLRKIDKEWEPETEPYSSLCALTVWIKSNSVVYQQDILSVETFSLYRKAERFSEFSSSSSARQETQDQNYGDKDKM